MSFLTRLFVPYRAFVALIDGSGERLWHYDRYLNEFLPCFHLLDRHWTDWKPSVHVRQTTKNGKPLRYKALDLSPDSARRWTHNSDLTAKESYHWFFVDLQIFYPPRAELRTRDVDFYVQIGRLDYGNGDIKAIYQQYILVLANPRWDAVRQNDFDKFEEALVRIRGVVGAYHASIRVVSLNECESIFREKFGYLGMLSTPLPDVSRSASRWQPVALE